MLRSYYDTKEKKSTSIIVEEVESIETNVPRSIEVKISNVPPKTIVDEKLLYSKMMQEKKDDSLNQASVNVGLAFNNFIQTWKNIFLKMYNPKIRKYYLKEKTVNNICISWGRDDDDPFSFRCWKHKNSSWFKRFSKVIDLTFFGRRLVIEF